MRDIIKNPWGLGLATALLSVSLVACVESSLEAKIRKDGSIDVVATGQVTRAFPEAKASIAVDEDQGISIDPTAIEEGSFHIRIVLPSEEEPAEDTGTDSTGTDVTGEDDTQSPSTVDKGTVGDETKKDATDSASVGETDEKDTSSTLAGAIFSSVIKPVDRTTLDEKVVFERTLSALDDNSDILTVTDVDEGYYLIYVTTDHATGTVKIRPYDLSTQEIVDRDSQKVIDRTREFFNGLFGDGTEAAEMPSSETTSPSEGTKATSNAATPNAPKPNASGEPESE